MIALNDADLKSSRGDAVINSVICDSFRRTDGSI